MPLSITCPHCDKGYKLAPELRGKRIRCKACQETFVVKDQSAAAADLDEDDRFDERNGRLGQASPRPVKKSRPAREVDEEEERPRRRNRNRPVEGSSTLPVLLVGGALLLVLVALFVVGAIWVFWFLRAAPAPVAMVQRNQSVLAGPAPVVAPQPAVQPDKAVPQPADPPMTQPPAAAPIVAPAAPMQVPPADPAPAVKVAAGQLYGDQGGEAVAPADGGAPNTVMRARRDDTFFRLSNPRQGQTDGPGPKHNALLVDYVVVHRGKWDGGVLIIHTEDGGKAEVPMHFIIGRDHGTIELVGVTRFGNLRLPKNVTFPKNAEMYVTRGDAHYRPPGNFMVSNSLVMGEMKVTTRPREWTPEEIDRYGKPPPNYTTPNVHPTVGLDVPPLEATGPQLRYVEPDGRLLGLDYRMGEWEKEKCIGGVVPIFTPDQPPSLTGREMARPGYAVAGAEVSMGKYVDAIRLLYRRVKPDGSLDATDAYAGEWIGTPGAGEAKMLVNDGRRVLGINVQQGGVMDRFALVVAKP